MRRKQPAVGGRGRSSSGERVGAIQRMTWVKSLPLLIASLTVPADALAETPFVGSGASEPFRSVESAGHTEDLVAYARAGDDSPGTVFEPSKPLDGQTVDSPD